MNVLHPGLWMKRKSNAKPDIIRRVARHVELTAKLKEAEEQARKFAEACVALEKAGSMKKAASAKASCLRWLTVERELKKQLQAIEDQR